MPADKAFFDTNILVYAFSTGDPRRSAALDLLLTRGTVSIQTLNEFVNVVTGKMKVPWPEAMVWLDAVAKLCLPPIPVTLAIHHRGLQIAQFFGYHIYDSLMLAAALEASCMVFYTEDMQDGQIIDTLTIRNPFGNQPRASSPKPSPPCQPQ
jgi:predicted nucleic acid-binding protein